MMLFLKNLLLRNFQGCCLLFNYQGSCCSFQEVSLIFYHAISSLSRTFLFFFSAVCFGSTLPHKSAYIDYHICFPLSRTFFIQYSGLLSRPASVWPCGWFFSLVCLSDKWYLITGRWNCQRFFDFFFNSDNSLLPFSFY